MEILVVDDEPLIRELLGDFLREQGHAVVDAENGLVAWGKLDLPPVIVPLRELILRGSLVGGTRGPNRHLGCPPSGPTHPPLKGIHGQHITGKGADTDRPLVVNKTVAS